MSISAIKQVVFENYSEDGNLAFNRKEFEHETFFFDETGTKNQEEKSFVISFKLWINSRDGRKILKELSLLFENGFKSNEAILKYDWTENNVTTHYEFPVKCVFKPASKDVTYVETILYYNVHVKEPEDGWKWPWKTMAG